MYDSVATLKGNPTTAYDQYGNEILTYEEAVVFVQPRSVYASEFYNAAQAGLHPSITFELTNRADYNGEKVVEWEEKTYDVIRADWTAQRDAISLVCEERIGKGPEATPPEPLTEETNIELTDEGSDVLEAVQVQY